MERLLFAALNGVKKVLGTLFTPSIQRNERLLVFVERVKISIVLEQAEFNQLFDNGLTKPFNVHCAAMREVLNPAFDLGGAFSILTEIIRFVFLSVDARAALRAFLRHHE